MLPTPFVISDDVIRVYITCLDSRGVGRPGFVDVEAGDPTRVIAVSPQPLLDVGRPGTFDDNGIAATSVIRVEDNRILMYYAGFELCEKIRYRIFTGVAVSEDGGTHFRRIGEVPILDRTSMELYFRCGAFASHESGKFRLWYVAGSEWTEVNGKALPQYDLRYVESADGLLWPSQGRVIITISDSDEHGFGRPWVVSKGDGYELFYSIRRRSTGGYCLGYASSKDGTNWIRRDGELGLGVSDMQFENQAVMYAAAIEVRGRTYCFYNGNDFGRDGFALAELVSRS